MKMSDYSMFESRCSHTTCVLLPKDLPPLCLWPTLETFLFALLLSDPPFSLTLLDVFSDTVLPLGFSSATTLSCLKLWRFSQTQECSGVKGFLEQNHLKEL